MNNHNIGQTLGFDGTLATVIVHMCGKSRVTLLCNNVMSVYIIASS